MIKNNFDDVYYPNNLNDILYQNVDEKMIEHIKRPNKEYMDTIAMTFMGVSITYREFFKNVGEYAKALKSYGLSKGDAITLAMPNIPETIYYFYACNDLGITPYLIDPRSTFGSMVHCILESHSNLFVCEMGTYYSKVAKYIDKLPTQNVVVCSPVFTFQDKANLNQKAMFANYLYSLKGALEETKLLFHDTRKKYSQKDFIQLGSQYDGNVSVPYDPEIPAIIVNTSGTTGGSVKGAMHSNRSYNIYTNQIPLITEHLVRGNTYYGYVPYFSMYGSCVGMHTALTHGIVIDNIPKFEGKKSLYDIIKKQSNILIAVPNLIEKLTDLCEKEKIDATFIKQYVIGGDNVAPEQLKHENEVLESLGMASKIIFGYGSTEAMPIATTSFDERSQIYGSTGIPYPGVSIKIINPENLEELPHHTEGEIYAHTPNLMVGYLNMPQENDKVFHTFDGVQYFKTGDKGYLTEDGILFITGRYKRMMKRPDGHQTSPIPIENAICNHSLVSNCAVVGIKRKNGIPGVIPTAFIIPNKNSSMIEKDLVATVAGDALQTLSGERETALAYVIVDELPFTINGKLDFKKLEELCFDDLNFYALDDAVCKEYFQEMQNFEFIRINKGLVKTLKK